MKKYFRVHDYSKNMKERVSTFSPKGRVDIWWEYSRNVKEVKEEGMSYRIFERYFKEKYLSKEY